ncbi:stabilin-1 isoform X2 [Alligator mississippiensis]|uniref:stabilin-1 isoform X2 n=1 Tax=Alligator mississippiensis TaxID=8496 RepID=UPI002877B212|nr:stabilin-1 isoform X2 [Alligator mississippiensis]
MASPSSPSPSPSRKGPCPYYMKMHLPGLLFFLLTASFISTTEGQTQKLRSMQCNVKMMFTLNTPCTSCAASPKSTCPKGWIKVTQGLGERNCKFFYLRYTVKLGEDTLSLPGCSHMCKKEIEDKKCCPGFWGTECYECPGGSENPCSGHGTCLNGITQNGTCICEERYSGSACQNCRDETLFGPGCQSVCDCQHGVCNHGITGNGSCTCYGGYTGPKCDQELPLCRELTCEPKTQCVVKAGVARCDCIPGYSKVGSVCQVQDPCASSPCSSLADCKVLGPLKYECTCKDGYQGDGEICQPINPCIQNNGGCPEKSTLCIYKGPGRSSCMCKPGMSSLTPSAGCSFISECQRFYCDMTSQCKISPNGSPSCVCKEGEIGDGRSCYKSLMSEISQLNTRGRFLRKLNSANKMFASGCSLILTKYGPFTVFVPTLHPFNDKFDFNDTIAENLCKMHIIPGQHLLEDMIKTKTMWTLSGHQLTFNDPRYSKSFRYQDVPGELYTFLQWNLPAANGIMHIVNTLRKKPTFKNLGNPQKTIGEILASMEIFSRFETILENCGLPSILDGPGPFTVFVPSNEGVDKLRDGRLIYLFTEGINKLQELVKHHIYTVAAVTVEKLLMMPHIITMANQIVTINISTDGRILLTDSGIPLNMKNIVASNGIIHTLDGIFIPSSIIPILPQRCNEVQHTIVTGSCVDCKALNTSLCPPYSTEVEPEPLPKECVYVHDPLGLNVMKKGCARYCNQTILKPGCCKGFFGPDCTQCPGGFSNPCYGRGNCSDGTQGNGNCHCFEGFKGIACHICSNPNKHGENCDEDCGCVHGICDNRPGSGGVCQSQSCKDGYTGKFCDKTSKNCGSNGLSQYCHQNAVCSLNDTARCICMDGYEGNGFSCQPIDLCKKSGQGGCSENALCTSTGPGTATCRCNKGWTGDGKACVAINNCELETRGGCHVSADCIYVGPGQSNCICKRGYFGDGYNCDPIDPCLLDNGGCSNLAICKPLGGGERSCSCSQGYMGDGIICYGDVLKELARNSHFAGFYEWIQKSAFSIPAGTNVTVLVPLEAAIKNMSKAEKDFWLTSYMLPVLVRSHFLQGSFTSEQLKKYDGQELPTLNPQMRWEIRSNNDITIQNARTIVADIPSIDGIIFIINKVLLPPLGSIPPSPPRLQKQLDMIPSFSIFKELLVQYQLIGQIESAEKYTIFVPGNSSIEEYCHAANITQLDSNTVQYHVILGEKLLSTDLKSGVHKSTMLGISYWLMFYNNSTQTSVNNILLNGKIFETMNGMLFGVAHVLQIQKNHCTANTTTVQKSKCGKCDKGIKCPPGSILAEPPGSGKIPHCELWSGDKQTLGCYFTCIKVSLRSVCCPGYYGHMCEMCPGKPGNWCSGNGVCLDGIAGSGECQCNEGFHGTACEMCEVGRYGPKCKSECACINGLCNDGLYGDGSCKCFQGWKGIYCEESIGIDLCNNTCHQMANCINDSVESLPICSCSAGYTGNGTHCTEINPCTFDNGGCSIHATCTKVSPGEKVCSCKEGYAGDGTLCLEVDLCLEDNGGCHAKAECSKAGPNKVSCNCLPGYSGDGQKQCDAINLCKENNGGCNRFGICEYTGPGTRRCSCSPSNFGDGFTCRGNLYQELMRSEAASIFFKKIQAFNIKEINGAGVFTIFVPNAESIQNSTTFAEWENHTLIKDLVRYHIVGCHKLLSSDLEMQESIVALSGHKIHISVKENSLYLNDDAKVITSDLVGLNGVIHIIDKILIPGELQSLSIPSQLSQQNVTDVAEAYGYKIYSKLLREAGLLTMVNNPIHRPFTMLWPTDAVFNSFPEKRQKWLYHKDHRDELAAYLKVHMIRDMKIVAGNLPHINSVRTMHGSTISFSCSRSNVGELLVDNGNAKIVQRHMEFNGGIAYGIDQLLEPPNLGSRCDEFLSIELKGSVETCGLCGFEPSCPPGSVQRGESKMCLYYYENAFYRSSSYPYHRFMFPSSGYFSLFHDSNRWPQLRRSLKRGCRRNCFSTSWVPQCCANHYGRDCRVCPGGLEAPCSNRGICDDRIGGSGQCNCTTAFIGTACELCAPGRYGPECKECNCTKNGMCNEGLHGDGFCFCSEGWTGEHCETKLALIPVCSPACHPQAVCKLNNVCECSLHYEGDGRTCTVIDRCQDDNGGCSEHANCTQIGVDVSCTCLPDYQGDGYVCSPIDKCADGRNGDCSEHALCISTGPNAYHCECKPGYVGNGIQCLEEAVPPVDRCLEENGSCHRDAICTDLHFHDKTAGVFHLQSPRGKYKFTYREARAACAAEGASLATLQELSAAQQMSFHLCLVGWLDNGTAGYPTAYPNPNCGSSHVGIVNYGFQSDLNKGWDAFCYRAKDVMCSCQDGFIGDGYFCSGNLLAVLAEHENFSTFYSMLLDFANITQDGLDFLNFLSNDTTYKTVFIPLNSGFGDNMTLTWEELKLHVSMSNIFLLSFNLTDSTVIPSCSGYNLSIAESENRTQLTGSRVANNTLIVEWDILAYNGIIHAIERPLQITRPTLPLHVDQITSAAKSSNPVTVGVTSVVVIVMLFLAIAGVAYYYLKMKQEGFQFHYFKADMEEELSEQEGSPSLVSIPNPVYGAHNCIYEPFDDSFNGEDFSDNHRILE